MPTLTLTLTPELDGRPSGPPQVWTRTAPQYREVAATLAAGASLLVTALEGIRVVESLVLLATTQLRVLLNGAGNATGGVVLFAGGVLVLEGTALDNLTLVEMRNDALVSGKIRLLLLGQP